MSPFSQFETAILRREGGNIIDISVTNAGVYMIVGIISYLLILNMSRKRVNLVGTYWQQTIEGIYEFLEEMVKEQVGRRAGGMFPLIYTIFCFILVLNLLGLIPFSFAVTGQIIVTIMLSSINFIAWIIVGVRNFKKEFLRVFVPSGVSKSLLPLLVVIEVLSFLIRPISLAIRLFANILAGHILLLIISTFVLVTTTLLGVIGVMPFLALCAFYVLEIGIAFLQAYVFSILLCIYLKDAYELH